MTNPGYSVGEGVGGIFILGNVRRGRVAYRLYDGSFP